MNKINKKEKFSYIDRQDKGLREGKQLKYICHSIKLKSKKCHSSFQNEIRSTRDLKSLAAGTAQNRENFCILKREKKIH